MKKIPIWKNTLTSYLGMTIRLVQGILLTRWLIADLGPDHYGFWAMLWSFFCYSLLLDFGLGTAAQKATATELWRRDILRYNRVISTVFSFHLAMSVFIAAGTVLGVVFIRQLLHLEGEAAANPHYYRTCFLVCGLGSAALFPFGVFTEILVGLQKIYVRNYIQVVSKLLELFGVLTIFLLGGGLLSLTVFSISLLAATQLAMMRFVFRSIPGFRLALRPDKSVFREIFHFSGAVYAISMAKLVWERGSTFMISVFCGLSAVTTYSVGVRLSVLMNQLTGPYQENISPLAALLHSRKKREKLGGILVNSMRWNSFLATGLTIGLVLFARVAIRFLFGVDSPDSALICRLTVLAGCITLVFRTIPEKFLLMAERHKYLAKVFVAESALFVAASVLLLSATSLPGVFIVMGASIGSRLFGTTCFILPRMIRDCGLRVPGLLWNTFGRQILASVPAIAAGALEPRFLSGRVGDLPLLLIAGLTCGPLYLFCSCAWIMTDREKRKIPFLSRPRGEGRAQDHAA